MFTSFSRMSRSFRMRDLGLLAIASLMMAMPAYPQQTGTSQAASGQSDNAALQQKIRDLEDRLIALEGQVRLLKSQAAPAPSPAGAPGATAETTAQAAPVPPAAAAPLSQAQAISLGGAGGSAAKALNPDISAIGDFIAVAGHNPVQPSPSLEMHESELGFQAIIDPYARGDFFLSFGEEGVNLEEGYITFTALPAGFVAKVGKMRSAFGKVNTMHNHVLPWVDRPLVTNNRMGAGTTTRAAIFLRSFMGLMPRCDGSRCAAPSTIPLSGGASSSGASASNCLSSNALSAFIHLLIIS